MWQCEHMAGTAKSPLLPTIPPFPPVGAGTAENSSSRAIPRLSGRDSGSVPGARTLTQPAGLSTRCDRCLTDQIVSNFCWARSRRRVGSAPAPVCYRRARRDLRQAPPADSWRISQSAGAPEKQQLLNLLLQQDSWACVATVGGSWKDLLGGKKNVAVRVSDANMCTHACLFWFIGNPSFCGQVTFFSPLSSTLKSQNFFLKVQQI